MKTETAIVLVVLIIGGVAAFKLFSRQQVIYANTPLGANLGTVQALAPVANQLITGLENIFTGGAGNSGYGNSPDFGPYGNG